SIISTWRAPTPYGATSGARENPDRRADDPRDRRVRRSRRRDDRHRRLLRGPGSGAPLRDPLPPGARTRLLAGGDPGGGADALVRRGRVLRRAREPPGRGGRARPRPRLARERAGDAAPGAGAGRALPVPRRTGI